MIIYPAIELKDGKCVMARRGQPENVKVYDDNPVEKAKEFAAAGAQWIHVTDVDAVMQGGRQNADQIVDVINAIGTDSPTGVQVAGGIRTVAGVEWWMEHGAQRVIIGTAAVKDRPLIERACAMYPGRIVGAINGRGGNVWIEGWQEDTALTVYQVAEIMEGAGVAAIIYTDIDLDDQLPDASFATTAELARICSVPVISSGTIRTLDDISRIKYLDIEGAIVGRALFEKTFTLQEAIALTL